MRGTSRATGRGRSLWSFAFEARKMTLTPPYALFRPFLPAFADAIHFCDLAHLAALTDPLMPRYVKASLLNSALSLEALANVLVENIREPPKELRKRLDRISVFEKFQFFAWLARPDVTLDFGSPCFQKARELIDIRDRSVHTRTSRHQLSPAETGPGQINFTEADKSISKHLGIPHSLHLWQPSCAVIGLKVVDELADHLLLTCFGFQPEKTTSMLSHKMIVDADTTIMSISNKEKALIREGKQRWGICCRILTDQLLRE